MKIDGKDIPTSEFEYLYKKNISQQLEPQTFEEYLELFKVYRLKVAEAKFQCKDTTESFRKEMAQYRRELLEPYLNDSTFLLQLVDIEVARDREDMEASHIMLAKTTNKAENTKRIALLDSLRTEIINGADFASLADKYSEDNYIAKEGGYIGYISAGRFPYAFECAVYETPEGNVSDVIESPAAYHIVKSGKRRPSKGRVSVAHILKLTPAGSTDEELNSQKAAIDSLYQLAVANPDLFGELASRNSDDRGTASMGGMLPVFGVGEMVPEFEEMAFSLTPGQISEPFKSHFGWHIIKKFEEFPTREYSQIKQEVERKSSMPQDPRFQMIEDHKYGTLKEKFGKDKSPEELIALEEEWQYANNEDYRNLVNEYTDGSMLYEISNEKVWSPSTSDEKGLEKFFNKHRKNYTFVEPRAKGVIIESKNDSILKAIKMECKGMTDQAALDYVKSHYAGDIRAESFIAPRGKNSVVDYYVFDSGEVDSENSRYPNYIILNQRILTRPETWQDVKTAVVSNYQEELEKNWVKELKKKHKVEINTKELKKVKSEISQNAL